jgi:hypothetical protein
MCVQLKPERYATVFTPRLFFRWAATAWAAPGPRDDTRPRGASDRDVRRSRCHLTRESGTGNTRQVLSFRVREREREMMMTEFFPRADSVEP